MKWDWLVQEGVDPDTGREIDPPRFDGGPIAWGCLIFAVLLAVGVGAILVAFT